MQLNLSLCLEINVTLSLSLSPSHASTHTQPGDKQSVLLDENLCLVVLLSPFHDLSVSLINAMDIFYVYVQYV